MRLDPDDLKARAVIRDQALRLFADRGPEGVTLREIAAAAGVSPGLIVHHYGSKHGLYEAVDAHVLGIFDALLGELSARAAELHEPDAQGSLIDAVLAGLPADSPVPGYVRRLLTGANPAGQRLFAQLHTVSLAALEALATAGVASRGADPQVRAAILLANDLAVFIFRDRLTETLGVDPFSADGMTRWSRQLLAIYTGGLAAPVTSEKGGS